MSQWVGLLVVGLAAGEVAAAGAQENVVAIEHATVITMQGGEVLENHTVVVRGGRFVEIAPAGLARVPEEAIRIEGTGRFVIPGLTDAHVHLFDRNDLDLLLAYGVTTVLNMSGAHLQLAWREAVRQGELAGPTIYTTGPQLKLTAHPASDFERAITSEAEAEAEVAVQAAAGFDFVKVWGAFESEIYRAIMAAAERHDMRVTGHIPRRVGLEGVLAAGQSSIAHVEEYFNKVLERNVHPDDLTPPVALTSRYGVPVISTLVTYAAIAAAAEDDMTALLSRPGRELLDPVRRLSWEPEFNRYHGGRFTGRAEFYRAALALEQRLADSLAAAGVPLLAGTDAGELPGLVPGLDLHRELELLVESGLTPAEALETATVHPGRYLGGDADPFGAIAVGHRADLVVLDANPLDDIHHTREIHGVMVRGQYLSRADLDSALSRVRQQNARTQRFVAAVLEDGIEAAAAYVDRELASGAEVPFAQTPALLLAYSRAESGDIEMALGILQLTARVFPQSYVPYYMLGGALLAAGETEAASAALERVLELVPGHARAREMLQQSR